MPTVTVSLTLLETLGIDLRDVDTLDGDMKRALEPLLASRGFYVASPIHVTRLPSDEGFLLTQ